MLFGAWLRRCGTLGVLTVAAFVILTACNSGSHNDAVPSPSELKWTSYSDPDGAYRLEFPGKPEVTDRDEPSQIGHFTMHYLGARHDAADFEFGHANVERYVKKLGAQAVADAIRDCIGTAFGTKNIVVSKITCGAYTGSEYIIDLPEGAFPQNSVGDFRVFIVKNRLYEQVAVGSSAAVKGPTRDKFFKSLAFIDAPTVPTATKNKP